MGVLGLLLGKRSLARSYARIGRVIGYNANRWRLPRSVLKIGIANQVLRHYNKPKRLLLRHPKEARFEYNADSGSGGLRSFEDRRTWTPLGSRRPLLYFGGGTHRVMVGPGPVRSQSRFRTRPEWFPETFVPGWLAFRRANKLILCVRRAMRREVMHATGHAGKVGQKPPKRTWSSLISCLK